MNKASWTEQWKGVLPFHKTYEDSPENSYQLCSNIEPAEPLQGHPSLGGGEVDFNAPPESMQHPVDTPVMIDKDIGLLMVARSGHRSEAAYYARRLQGFFIRNLVGVVLPNRDANDNKMGAGS